MWKMGKFKQVGSVVGKTLRELPSGKSEHKAEKEILTKPEKVEAAPEAEEKALPEAKSKTAAEIAAETATRVERKSTIPRASDQLKLVHEIRISLLRTRRRGLARTSCTKTRRKLSRPSPNRGRARKRTSPQTPASARFPNSNDTKRPHRI